MPAKSAGEPEVTESIFAKGVSFVHTWSNKEKLTMDNFYQYYKMHHVNPS
jgi:hypothetical protein